MATLEALEARIATKRDTLLDLDQDLQKRREALANMTDLGAEGDALIRPRDELLAEWNSLEERRNEVRAIRAETERAWAEHQRATADPDAAKEKLSAVKEQLRKAERLVVQIEGLTQQRDALKAEIATLEPEARRLRDAQAEVERLRNRRDGLEREIAAAEGRLEAARAELGDVSARLETARAALAEAATGLADLHARQAVAEEGLREAERKTETEQEKLRATEASLKAVEEQLRVRRNELDGTGGGGLTVEDQLADLNVRPTVLAELVAWPLWQPAEGREPEAEALERVEARFGAVGRTYHPRTLRAFHTAMKVNETTQMTVLAGISGTGKSQLPRYYAAGMGIGFLQVPVQPRWDSPQDLMGFYNYIEGRFRPTDMARALWQLDSLNNRDAIADRLLLILMDEMNLARVEYHFSDFLSRLESRPAPGNIADRTLRKDAEIELEIPMPPGEPMPRVFPGYNLLFAGTMNEDESTQSLSDKVVDRANVIRFGAPTTLAPAAVVQALPEPKALSRDRWRSWVRMDDAGAEVAGRVERMAELMREFGRPFGHRLARAIRAYVANYPQVEGGDRDRDALADQVEMRLLPKLRGVEIGATGIDAGFDDLRRFVEQELGDHALAAAVGKAVDAARDGSGQFVWTGVTR